MYKKVPYYLKVIRVLLCELVNPFDCINLFVNKEIVLEFKNGIKLYCKEIIELLIIYETMFRDDYKVHDLKNPKYIIDVGGGIGDFSVFCAHRFPEAIVTVFEPGKASFKLLKKNILVNKLKNVVPIEAAVGNDPEYKLFMDEKNAQNSTNNYKNFQRSITVKGMKLDDVIKDHVDLLKLDCEGGEYEILQNLSLSAYKKIRSISIEYHNHIIADEDIKIAKILKEKGYIIHSKHDPYNQNIGYMYAQKN
ncbi:MAG: FkbM family methyltransferase [Candidatus Roizmanbacteria bacterium]